MMEYNPDNWVVVKCPSDGHMRVLGGWSGGFTQGNSWRMNSGITRVEGADEHWFFYGSSGSVYRCNKRTYMLKMNNASVWGQLKELGWELMDEDTDWVNMEYEVGDKQ